MLEYTPLDHEIMERAVEFFQLKTINLHQLENGFPTFENTADAVRWYLQAGYIKEDSKEFPTLYGFPLIISERGYSEISEVTTEKLIPYLDQVGSSEMFKKIKMEFRQSSQSAEDAKKRLLENLQNLRANSGQPSRIPEPKKDHRKLSLRKSRSCRGLY